MEFPKAQWIWLNPIEYPEQQRCRINGFQPEDSGFAVIEFVRSYAFDRMIKYVSLCFSGDTEYRLLCNGKLVATGPVTIPGDFMCNDRVRPWHYQTEIDWPVHDKKLDFYARVKLSPCGINEYSKGRGGWMLSGVVTFAKGVFETITTDESWLCRHDRRFIAFDFFVIS